MAGTLTPEGVNLHSHRPVSLVASTPHCDQIERRSVGPFKSENDVRVRWTKYSFDKPRRISEPAFLEAHLYPGTFRGRRWRDLAYPGLITIGRVLAVIGIIWWATVELAAGTLNDSPIFAWFLALAVIWVLLSFTLSSLSFLVYAIEWVAYWESVIKVASHHDDVGSFNRDLDRRGLLLPLAEARQTHTQRT